MENELRNYVPQTWDLSMGDKVTVPSNSKEFEEINRNIINAGIRRNILRLDRIQNLYTFGQLLLREQLLNAIGNDKVDYHRIRRYMLLNKDLLDVALEHNLDERRTGVKQSFLSQINPTNVNEVLIIVQTVTDEPFSKVTVPKRNTDYYIEYVAYLNVPVRPLFLN